MISGAKETQRKKFSRLKVMNSSSEEESSGEKEDEESSVQLDIPPTDDEEDEVPVKASRRSIAARLIKSEDESSDDDEDKLRKSLYLAEEDVEDDPSVEEQAYSKSTRQSILPHYEPDSEVDEDDDGSVLIAESDEEEENQKNPMGSPALSSTIRSPLKERTNNTQSISIDDSVEEIPSIEKKTVSKSYYDQVKAQKELLEHQKNTLESRRDLMKNLPDGGQKVLKKIEGLTHEIKAKQEEIDSMVVDENLSVKNEIARSFNNTNDSSISFHEVIPPQPQPKSMNDLVKMNDVKPIFFGKAGMETYNNMVQGVQSLCKDLLEQVKTRPADIEEIEPPKHLKIELMKHQKQALKFMMWRESLKPRGGILADGETFKRFKPNN